MKYPLGVDAEGNALDCDKDEWAWWVMDAEIEGSETKGAFAILEVAVNEIFATIGDDDEEGYN